MPYTTLLVERDAELPGLMTITLNRPEKLNALSIDVHDELQDVCRALQDDFETRVVILTGAGRAFSAGAELTSTRAGRPQSDLDRRLRVNAGGRTTGMLERLDQVTIGAVNGLAIGGAVVLLSCMDLRIAAKSAWFSIPEVELDLPLTWNALPRLMRELGPARTKELVMTCDRFTADDALRWGFLNHVYADKQVLPEARKLAARLLSMDAMSIAVTKAACSALARTMVPEEATWSDPDMMLLAYRLRSTRNQPESPAIGEASGKKPAAKKAARKRATK